MNYKNLIKHVGYNKSTGDIYWKTNGNKRIAGDKIGTLNSHGYLIFKLFGEMFSCHRAAWFLHYGKIPNQIDHINGVKTDNAISNLRDVTHQENGKNQRIHKNNTSGASGVYFDRERKKWVARIKHNGTRLNLGRFGDFDSAVRARARAEKKLGYHQNHGDRML